MTHKNHIPNDRDPDNCEACAGELAELDQLVETMTPEEKLQALEAVGFTRRELRAFFHKQDRLIVRAIAIYEWVASRRS